MNDTLQFEGYLKSLHSNWHIGKATWYYSNGKVRTTAYFDYNGKKNGEYVGYFPSGKIELKKFFLNDSIVGNVYRKYADDDSVYLTSSYNQNGKIDGDVNVYGSTHKKLRTGNYKDGKCVSIRSFGTNGNDTIYTPLFIQPEYPKGFNEFTNFFSKQLRRRMLDYHNDDLLGRLKISCKIDRNGKLHDFYPYFYTDENLAKEAIDILENCQQWTPSKVAGYVEPTEIYFYFDYYETNSHCYYTVSFF
jgi:hypothetical protein